MSTMPPPGPGGPPPEDPPEGPASAVGAGTHTPNDSMTRYDKERDVYHCSYGIPTPALTVLDPQRELVEVLDVVCDAYLEADTGGCGAIRGAFNGKDRVLAALETTISRAADAIASTGELQWLRRGLAAASILDVRLDPQDIHVSLGHLYRAAALAGLDPQPVFAEVAALSSDAYPSKVGSARALLAGFHDSDYFRESIAPEL